MGAQAVRVGEVLHGERVLGQAGEAIEIDAHAERDDELVVGKVDGDAAEALHHGHGLLVEVDAHDVGLADLEPRAGAAQRRHRVGGVDGGGGDLGQQRLEDEVVVVVDQLDVELVAAAARELLGGEDAAKSAANNENLSSFPSETTSAAYGIQAIPTPIEGPSSRALPQPVPRNGKEALTVVFRAGVDLWTGQPPLLQQTL